MRATILISALLLVSAPSMAALVDGGFEGDIDDTLLDYYSTPEPMDIPYGFHPMYVPDIDGTAYSGVNFGLYTSIRREGYSTIIRINIPEDQSEPLRKLLFQRYGAPSEMNEQFTQWEPATNAPLQCITLFNTNAFVKIVGEKTTPKSFLILDISRSRTPNPNDSVQVTVSMPDEFQIDEASADRESTDTTVVTTGTVWTASDGRYFIEPQDGKSAYLISPELEALALPSGSRIWTKGERKDRVFDLDSNYLITPVQTNTPRENRDSLVTVSVRHFRVTDFAVLDSPKTPARRKNPAYGTWQPEAQWSDMLYFDYLVSEPPSNTIPRWRDY